MMMKMIIIGIWRIPPPIAQVRLQRPSTSCVYDFIMKFDLLLLRSEVIWNDDQKMTIRIQAQKWCP
jgi:hypothetical protein